MAFRFNDPAMLERRRELRRNQTEAEALLWDELKKLKYDGIRVRRQFGVGSYILDFYCPSKRLAIEVDGGYHEEEVQIRYDKERTAYLNTYNIQVIRYSNQQIAQNIQGCLEQIKATLNANKFSHTRLLPFLLN